MKIVRWSDDANPVIVFADGELTIIEDCPRWDNFEIGDMIQHHSQGFGTSCYFVVDVCEPAPDLYPRNTKLVTIKGAV